MQWQSLELFIGQSTGALAFVFPDAVKNFHSKACSTRSAPSSSSRRVSKAEMSRRSSDPISGLPAAPFHDRQSDAVWSHRCVLSRARLSAVRGLLASPAWNHRFPRSTPDDGTDPAQSELISEQGSRFARLPEAGCSAGQTPLWRAVLARTTTTTKAAHGCSGDRPASRSSQIRFPKRECFSLQGFKPIVGLLQRAMAPEPTRDALGCCCFQRHQARPGFAGFGQP